MPRSAPFVILRDSEVRSALAGRHEEILDVVERAYRSLASGDALCPASAFLRFPDRPSDRIIALMASMGERGFDGVKWISSVPANRNSGLPRASGVIILNDPVTGYPVACMDAAAVSATRTAASAVFAAGVLVPSRRRARRVAFVGAGPISRYVHSFLIRTGWTIDEFAVFDTIEERKRAFSKYLALTTGFERPIELSRSCGEALDKSDLVVVATSATEPHISDPSVLGHCPVILHISLRDIAPDLLLSCFNVVDSVEHVFREQTSLHLAEQRAGSRSIAVGDIVAVADGDVALDRSRPIVFSPFGLGLLDISVASYVLDRSAGKASTTVWDFMEIEKFEDPI